MNLEEFNSIRLDYQKQRVLNAYSTWFWIKRISIAISVIIILGMAGCPPYNVWQQGLTGKAELTRSEQNRQVKVEEAKARLESAKYDAEAEVARAKGVAEANKIVADGLGGPEGYLRYLFIEGLKNRPDQTIYIPTEAGLPILEAGKR